MRILLLGGSKSGKSMLGQRLTRQLADGGPMIYWATLEPRDTEDRAIVCRHLAERDGWGFGTLERGRALPEGLELVPREGAVLFDSVTACLACQMFSGPQPDAAAAADGDPAGDASAGRHSGPRQSRHDSPHGGRAGGSGRAAGRLRRHV